MKKTKKIVALVLAAVMLVCTTVAATVAYLQSKTEVVTNTFTVGKVVITLDEAKVTEYGVKDGETRVMENTYKLVSNHEYVKDPTVHVDKDSENCFVFVEVVNGLAGFEKAGETTIAEQMKAKGWYAVEGATNIYYYGTANGLTEVDADNTNGTDLVVFEKFVTDATVELANTDGTAKASPVTIKAYAIQADGFAGKTAAEVWTVVTK